MVGLTAKHALQRLVGVMSAAVAMLGIALGQESSRTGGPLVRRYREGDKTSYHMTASNKDVHRDLQYEADAVCAVKKSTDGVFVEDFEWTALVVNKKPVPLPTGKDAV